MRLRSFLACAVLVLTAGLMGACSDDDEHEHGEMPPECQELLDACHLLDDGSASIARSCHLVAHESDAAKCSAERQKCLGACLGDGGS